MALWFKENKHVKTQNSVSHITSMQHMGDALFGFCKIWTYFTVGAWMLHIDALANKFRVASELKGTASIPLSLSVFSSQLVPGHSLSAHLFLLQSQSVVSTELTPWRIS